MVVYTVTYAFNNMASGFNSTNYSTGTVYLNNIKSNNLQVNSNITLSNSINSWTYPSMLGSQYTIALASNTTLSNGVTYNILSYTIPQIGVYSIQAQFVGIFGSNAGVSYLSCSISTTSATLDPFFQNTVLMPPMTVFNQFTNLNREIQITNTTTTLYMVAHAAYCTTNPYLNNNLTYMRITRIA